MTQPPDETDPLARPAPWGEEPTAYRPTGPDLSKPVSPSGDQPLGPGPDPTSPYAAGPPPGPHPTQPFPSQPYPQPYPQAGPPPGAYGAPYGAYPVPGAPGYPFGQAHGGANTAMGLGIASVVVSVLGGLCCGIAAVVGVVLGPIALVMSLRARKDMAISPGLYNNPGAATTGLVTGIIGTVIGVGAVVLTALFIGLFAWGGASGY